MKNFCRAVFFLNIAAGIGLFAAGIAAPRAILAIMGAVGAISLKLWLSHANQEEQSEAMWGKYDRAGGSKVPRYHDI